MQTKITQTLNYFTTTIQVYLGSWQCQQSPRKSLEWAIHDTMPNAKLLASITYKNNNITYRLTPTKLCNEFKNSSCNDKLLCRVNGVSTWHRCFAYRCTMDGDSSEWTSCATADSANSYCSCSIIHSSLILTSSWAIAVMLFQHTQQSNINRRQEAQLSQGKHAMLCII